jgi:DNA-binding response OmpR family regulator
MRAPLVLVAEDDADLRDLVALTLTDAGMDVELAANGREALARVAQRRPDLVLLDMMMPVLDGKGFCEALRLLDEDPPRVVVMTAADRVAQSAAAVCAVSWIAKPFDIDELVLKIRRFLPPLV